MIKIFRYYGVLQLITILAIAVIACVVQIIPGGEAANVEGAGPMWELIKLLTGKSLYVSVIAGTVLTVGEGYMLARILYNRGLSPINTLMPMLMFLIWSLMGGNTQLSPLMFVNLFTLLALMSFMPRSGLVLNSNGIFNSMAYVAIGTMFYLPAVFLIIPISIAFLNYKLYSVREWVIALFGFMAPYIVMITAMFLFDKTYLLIPWSETLVSGFGVRVDNSVWGITCGVIEVIAMLYMLFWTIGKFQHGLQTERRHGTAILVLLLWSLAAMFYTRLVPFDGATVAISMSMATSLFLFSEVRRHQWTREVVVWLFIAFALGVVIL